MLSVAGLAAYSMTPWIGLAVAVVLLVVVASYRQNVHAYPSGGGDYEVVTTNLGDNAGLLVASALMVDYVLTVAVSTASAMSNIGSAIPFVADHTVLFSVSAILLVMAMNLRGVRESGVAFAIPTYAFIAGVLIILGWGFSASTRWVIRCGRVRRICDACRARQDRRFRADVFGGTVVLVGMRGTDRGGGNQQRGTSVSETQVPQRRNDTADVGHHRGDPVYGHHRAGREDRRAGCR
ncbi:amino acid permease family protein [Mycobacterium xenopi 4042]|uniref:Amino acid permease family protein n=1 Tax=Mycobacterium xenopi 4042 TaxID=1299334 RepID=X8CEM6_MYCXE|nr:amino acid permease family protein [Mycobacterium xenopi 4042]